MLESLGWYGKALESADNVHPLLFQTRSGTLIPLDPRLMPVCVALRWSALAKAVLSAWPSRLFSVDPRSRCLDQQARTTARTSLSGLNDRLLCDIGLTRGVSDRIICSGSSPQKMR
jgi:uncharacterized protein YjiS (DUF1127 family)